MVGVLCDAATVKRYINTALSDSDIGLIVEDSDEEIYSDIGPQDAGNKEIRKLAALITARAIRNRDPQSVIVGPFSARQNPLESMDSEIERIKGKYSTRCELV